MVSVGQESAPPPEPETVHGNQGGLAALVISLLLIGALGLVYLLVGAVERDVVADVPFWLPILVATLVLTGDSLRIQLPLAARTLGMDLTEVGVVLALVLLPPSMVVLPVVIGVLVASVLLRETWLQLTFNTAVAAAGSSVAALVVGSFLDGGPFAAAPADILTPVGLLAVVLGVLAYGAINLVAAGMLLTQLEAGALDLVARSMLLGGVLTLLLSSSLGIIAAVLLSASPLALPALVLPVWIAQRALVERAARIREDVAERDRLTRTVQGAKDGIALLDAAGCVELANPAFSARLPRTEEDVVGRPLVGFLQDWRFDPAVTRDDADAVAARENDGSADTASAADAVAKLLDDLTPAAPDAALNLLVEDRVFTLAVTGLFDQLGTRTGTVVLLIDVTASWEADQLRRNLVARVSHELRTPLTSIEGFVETLQVREAEITREQRRHYLEVIERQARRLHRLVSTLLWSARIERDRAEPQPEQLALSPAIDEAMQVVRDLLSGPVTVDVGDLVVEADADHLQQILINLLTNAVSYGQSPVMVWATPRGDHVEVVVSDTGSGVPDAFVERLFEPLTQSSVGDRRTAAGLGLGLSIVRSLVEGNGGSISYRRRDEATEFAFRLPAGDAVNQRAKRPRSAAE